MLHLYSADQARPLAARLSEVLSTEPADPMVPEWLAVPSDGMRRWLTLELAGSLGRSGPGAFDGVAANFIRAYPGTLRSTVLRAGLEDADTDTDRWGIEELVWSVLAAAEADADDPKLAPYFAVTPGASRYAKARRMADLFDRYHLHRPGMIRAWANGDDADGSGRALPPSAAWQPHLWRRVRAQIGEPSPPEQLPGLLDRLRDGTLALDLPPRLILFGFALLPGGGFLDLARAVAEQREVHLFLLQPTDHNGQQLLVAGPRTTGLEPRGRNADATWQSVHQPLLRSWGRLHRETALLLADATTTGVPEPEWVGSRVGDPLQSLLQRLQHDLRTDARPGEPLPYEPGDGSVQFHACYGTTRQVEVLRDAILHLLNEPGSDLVEDDILVVCPALDRFAPLIDAAFGPSVDPLGPTPSGPEWRPADTPGLRYRIADQSIRSTNPVLNATSVLLELVAGRFSVTSVLDFLGLGPVRERFRLDDEALSEMAGWVTETNVRWGLDPEHRSTFGLPESIQANTWRAALDRLLVGSTVRDDEWSLSVGEVSPYGIEGSATERLGQLAEVLRRLGTLAAEAGQRHPIAHWIGLLRQTSGLLLASDRDSQWQIEALQRVFDDVLQSATGRQGISQVPLTFVDVRRLFDERLRSIPGRPDYFRGGITVSSMTPLRWVPFRVVCLLGMDQSAFSSVTAPGDDLTAVRPQIGDPDPRAESRQSLLEAVLSAGDHLIVVRDGHDVRSNQVVPRAVVVAELFDAVTELVGPEDRRHLATRLEIGHPRQAFDERCFTEDGLAPGGRWGFDHRSLEGAQARRRRTSQRSSFLADPLDGVEPSVIDLDDLHRFFKNPVAAFVSQRLEAWIPKREEDPTSLLPVELIALERWKVATRMLSARFDDVADEDWEMTERARGTLPPGSLGEQALTELRTEVDELVNAARGAGVVNGPPEPYEVSVELPGGVRVVGSVLLRLEGVLRGPAHVSYSKLKPEHRVASWLDLMALVGTDPSAPWRALAIGRSARSGGPADRYEIVPRRPGEGDQPHDPSDLGPGENLAVAREALSVAVDCYVRGMREPVPLFPTLSYEVYEDKAKAATWTSAWSRSFTGGDGEGPAVVLAYQGMGYDEVMSLPARPGDPNGSGGRVSRFAHYLHGTIHRTTRQLPDPASVSGSGGTG